ncbi:hypothetical protein EYB53_021730, partial [Candidatus Chloroploca sp. M-50]
MSMQRQSAKQNPATTPATGLTLQRQCACGQHTSGGGECAACKQQRLAGTLQRSSLAISQPGDRYEQEAERVANSVVGGGTIPALSLSAPAAIHRDGPPPTSTTRDPNADERRKYPGTSLPDLGFNNSQNDQHIQQ